MRLDSQVIRFETTGGFAVVAYEGDVGEVAIVMVNQNLRRRGAGTRLLTMIGQWADQEGRSLFLLDHPLASDAMDQQQLRAWYIERGWEPCRAEGMRRPKDMLIRLARSN